MAGYATAARPTIVLAAAAATSATATATTAAVHQGLIVAWIGLFHVIRRGVAVARTSRIGRGSWLPASHEDDEAAGRNDAGLKCMGCGGRQGRRGNGRGQHGRSREHGAACDSE